MSKCVPNYAIYKSKKKSKHPGILVIEGTKYYCKKRSKIDENGTQGFSYICSEWDGGCRASATLTTIQVCHSIPTKNLIHYIADNGRCRL